MIDRHHGHLARDGREHFCRSSRRSICDGLPPVATAGLHKGSIVRPEFGGDAFVDLIRT
jgi:hypothetical protein